MDENAATDEDRRVVALADELRISSDICPRELLSLRTTTPLESNDELDEEEGRGEEEEEEEEEEATSSRGGDISGNEGLACRYVLKKCTWGGNGGKDPPQLVMHVPARLPSQLHTPTASATAPHGAA